jgi:hypothetical protein
MLLIYYIIKCILYNENNEKNLKKKIKEGIET